MVNSAHIKWTVRREPVLQSTTLQQQNELRFSRGPFLLTHKSVLQPLRVRQFLLEQPIQDPSLS